MIKRLHLIVGLAVLIAAAPSLSQSQSPSLARAAALIDSGDAQAGLEILDRELSKKKSPNALLLRSTARFMLGQREEAIEDLDTALELDPSLRQGWLNRAALALSERRYEDAHAAFEEANQLDPLAADNHLNLGVTLILLGRAEEANDRFRRYIASQEGSASSYLLVSKNYSLAGYETPAIEHLERAVALDERQRLAAKTDPVFEGLLANVRFQRLLSTDSYRPPKGALLAQSSLRGSYEGGKGPLLGAVIDALGRLGIPFDPRVEVTPDWALLWADLRIKIKPGGNPGEGVVEFSAPPERFTAADWQSRIDRLTQQIRYELAPKIPGNGD